MSVRRGGMEITPGTLGRAALYSDPDEVAEALILWIGPGEGRQRIVSWFRDIADRIDRSEK